MAKKKKKSVKKGEPKIESETKETGEQEIEIKIPKLDIVNPWKITTFILLILFTGYVLINYLSVSESTVVAGTVSPDVLQEKIRHFEDYEYQASGWEKSRRVIVKAEVTEHGQNMRCIVTTLKGKAKRVYDKDYCARGQMENYIKEHKNHLHSGRTSCSSFTANQFRLFLHSAAYILLYTLRDKGLKGTDYAKKQFDIIRNKILKVGARVIEKASRIKFSLPGSYPYKYLFVEIHRNLALEFS